MKNTKNTKLVGFEPMSKAETAKVVGGPVRKPKKEVKKGDLRRSR